MVFCQINLRRQQKLEKILDFKSTRKFIEQRESERINKFDITAFVQSTVNLRIYQKVCNMNFMNKRKFNKKHYHFAKSVINDFINQVPKISEQHISLDIEKRFIKVSDLIILIARTISKMKLNSSNTSASSFISLSNIWLKSSC
jgi:hypothetical protein